MDGSVGGVEKLDIKQSPRSSLPRAYNIVNGGGEGG